MSSSYLLPGCLLLDSRSNSRPELASQDLSSALARPCADAAVPPLLPCRSQWLTHRHRSSLLLARRWNAFYRDIHEDLVKEHADLMVSMGLRDVGSVQ
jgi:hypothetical protein